ncbi:MAG: hypothetical protein ACTHKL_14455 [Streptosporangiaceae bacterium]
MTLRAARAVVARRRGSAPSWRGAAATVAIAAALAGCGATPQHARPVSGVLGKHAIAGLPQVTRALTPADVQKDSSLRGLAGKLRRWGYLTGWQRTFQGESRRLTLVVSRSLTFRTDAGASAFVRYLGQHVDSFYPFATSKPLMLAGQRSGWLIKPPMCACHMAQPLYAGVTTAGHQVRWLEINGPRASGAMLASLLAAVPGTAT